MHLGKLLKLQNRLKKSIENNIKINATNQVVCLKVLKYIILLVSS